MRKRSLPLVVVAAGALWATAQAPVQAARGHAAAAKQHAAHAAKKVSAVPAIGAARARAIQAALVRAGYLTRVNGIWDSASQLAMRSFQRAHHWQERFVPDSRALIALGLGPVHDADTLAVATPPTPGH